MSLLKTRNTHTHRHTLQKSCRPKKPPTQCEWHGRHSRQTSLRTYRQPGKELENMVNTHTHETFAKGRRFSPCVQTHSRSSHTQECWDMMMSAPRSGFHFYAVTLVDPLTVSNPYTPPCSPILSSKPHAIKKLCRQTKQNKNVKKKLWWGVKDGQQSEPKGGIQSDKSRDESSVKSIDRTGFITPHSIPYATHTTSLFSLSLSKVISN